MICGLRRLELIVLRNAVLNKKLCCSIWLLWLQCPVSDNVYVNEASQLVCLIINLNRLLALAK